ncbi:MAG TPA: type IV toxin-antitoxin system AbiEi family antitoxin domain-containing protein [Streptosporangiaceae bacterium]
MATRHLTEFGALLAQQAGIISRSQALECGFDSDAIGRRLRAGDWRRLQRGVYTVSRVEPARLAVLWAAVVGAGDGAVLSHQTAAELARLTDHESSLIHVSIPAERSTTRLSGVMVHRSRRLQAAAHPTLLPPRTRIEETVLDLVECSAGFGQAFDWACAACQRRLTTPDRLLTAMTRRRKMRWRNEFADVLTEVRQGVHSRLERGYAIGVERRHGLPAAARQVKVSDGARSAYLDNLYRDYGVCVELDGNIAHPAHRRWFDIGRDNAAAAAGRVTLRYGWLDVMERHCATAIQVGAVLQRSGWTGRLRPCGPTCPVSS